MTDSTETTREENEAIPTSPKAAPPPNDPDQATTVASKDSDEDEAFAFKHYLLRNIRYHTRRAALFSQWHKTTGFVGVFLGSSSAMSFLLAESFVGASIMAAIVAFFSAVDLVVGTATKEAQHTELRKRWIAFQKRFQAEGVNRELYLERTAIEMDEPPELSIVEMQARNDATLALMGKKGRDQLLVIPLHQRVLGQFINLDTSQILEVHEIRAKNEKAPA
ncbi:hypothetical protein [Chromohalobacter sp. 48-RD10]|uniref:hypothetical protein n=1 Tax=Chromohalobacter sp. 48-RD10 TaxID=2994063 RepID=UPI002468B0EA|nr:hypothetical protein [Chromohalobacter sp. 48-RD10]